LFGFLAIFQYLAFLGDSSPILSDCCLGFLNILLRSVIKFS